MHPLFFSLALFLFNPCSITIQHDPIANGVAVICRMDQVDLNNAILTTTGTDPGLGMSHLTPQSDTLIKRYLTQHLQLSIGDSALPLRYLSRELTPRQIVVYLGIPKLDRTDGLTVRTDLFKELYADQQIQVRVVTEESIEEQMLGNGLTDFTFGLSKDR